MHTVAQRAAEFGVEIEGPVRFNLPTAMRRKDSIVGGIIDGIYGALERRKDAITFVRGEAHFLNDHEIDTGERRISFGKAIIATGARNATPPIDGLAGVDYLTNRTALQLSSLPSRLVILGGGYIGIEFAQMVARFGAQVTLLGRNIQLAPGEDRELADLLAGYLREEGIDVRTGTPVVRVRANGSEKVVTARVEGQERDFACDALLVASGRVGNTDSLRLAQAGIATHGKGFVEVDSQLQSS